MEASELERISKMIEMKRSWYISYGLLIQKESNSTLNSAAKERYGMSEESIPIFSCFFTLKLLPFLFSTA